MRKKIFNIIGCILIVFSILCFLYPEISSAFDDIRSDKVITDIQKYPKKKKAQLYQKASEYNQKIYESGQNELKDVWSYKMHRRKPSGLPLG